MNLIQVCTTASGTYTDLTDYCTPGELEISPEVYAPKRAQSPLTGNTYGGFVATKRKITASLRPMKQSETSVVLPLLANEYLYVNYQDPALGWRTAVKMISNNAPATARSIIGGTLYWTGISFELTEV